MKKILSVLAAVVCCAMAATGSALTLTGYEMETVGRSWEKSAFFPRMEALTGIAAQGHGVEDAAEYAKLLDAMTAGQITADALFKANLSRKDEIRLLDSGAIIDLSGMIENCMPNLSALLAEHPEWREKITLPDGRIASLPLLDTQQRQICVYINRAWLEKLGLEMPKNLQELTEALSAMKKGDPNGNGREDETPAELVGVWEMRWLLPFFGIIADDYNLARSADGSLIFAPELPAYRDFVEMLAQWQADGLLVKDAFTRMHSTAALDEKSDDTTVRSGLIVSATPYTHVDPGKTKEFAALLMPGPDGNIVWRDLLGEVWTGCFAVTSACQNPEEALRWVDALYGEAGAVLAYAGAEGEDYRFGANGYWNILTSEWRDISSIRAQSLMYTGTAMPGLSPTDFIMQVDSDVDRYVLTMNADVKAVSQTVLTRTYDEETLVKANALNATLVRLVDEGIARFATGEQPLTDENWNAWLDTLRANGSGELVKLFE